MSHRVQIAGALVIAIAQVVCATSATATSFVSLDGIVLNQVPHRNAAGRLEIAVAPAAGGETLCVASLSRKFAKGDTPIEAELVVSQHRLWSPNDPYVYRVTSRLHTEGTSAFDEQSTRCGFRDFRFADGYFRLNGKRYFLRCSHTGNCTPIGLMVYEEPCAAWCMEFSPQFAERLLRNMLRFAGADGAKR